MNCPADPAQTIVACRFAQLCVGCHRKWRELRMRHCFNRDAELGIYIDDDPQVDRPTLS